MRALLGVLAALAAHPLHTTLTQIELRGADGSVQLTVRAFSDDLRAALGGDVSDSGAARPRAACVVRARRPLPPAERSRAGGADCDARAASYGSVCGPPPPPLAG